MRTWTRVLAEDDYLTDPPGLLSRQKLQLGALFDAFYFLGPDDVHGFFRADSGGGGSLVATVEAYFARKYAIDPDFWSDFGTVPGGRLPPPAGSHGPGGHADAGGPVQGVRPLLHRARGRLVQPRLPRRVEHLRPAEQGARRAPRLRPR
ncbi:hypothetical protein [Streptomyces tailanensis]|uniref:hypothetical protein n=1 Tax=Streptomyces tailanensis TaxID=2569858 RepID=UPI00122DF882|nr:hypothetical protein [Streptomyces tailanensis]